MSWVSLAVFGQAAEIRGVVIDNDTTAPISDASVQLLSDGQVVGETQSGEKGQFVLGGDFAGRFTVAVSQNGYIDLFADQRPAVTVSGSKNPPAVELRLTRTCAISGQVTGVSGEPVPGVKVAAMIRGAGGGKPTEVGKAAFTNDLGAFRIFDLPPGIYTVAIFPDGEETSRPAFTPVYFAGVTDASRAQFFQLAPGEMQARADFTVAPSPTVKIAGRVSGIPAEWTIRSIAVRLFSEAGDPIQTVFADGDGKFLFPAVPAGGYRVYAWGPILGGGRRGPEALPHGRAGALRMGTVASDTTGLDLELQDLLTVTGRVLGQDASQCSEGAQVSLDPVSPLLGDKKPGAGLNRGTFAIHDVPPGRYRVQWHSFDRSCYVKEAHSAGVSLENCILTVTGNVQMELVVATGSAAISGKVKLPDGSATPAQVVLIKNGDDSVRFEASDGKGVFRFEHLSPGNYQILALKKINSLDYLDPVFAAGHGSVSAAVTTGNSTTIEVTLSK